MKRTALEEFEPAESRRHRYRNGGEEEKTNLPLIPVV
jgi:hypothetical protein